MSGGGSTTNTTVNELSPEQRQLVALQTDYSKYVMPNAEWLNDTGASMLKNSLADMQLNYVSMNEQAQNQLAQANRGWESLTQGILPQSYLDNMQTVVNNGVRNSVGNVLNDLAAKGVVNSSVMNTAIGNIEKQAANTMAENYNTNINDLSGLYGQLANNAGQNITTAAAAQEGQMEPGMQYFNASLGLGGASNAALGSLAGKGTSTTTQRSSGGSMWSGILSAGANIAGAFI